MVLQPHEEAPGSGELYFRVLGRTLEHFGVQIYKRRTVAIAELVANCWDAGAKSVDISVPVENLYDPETSVISISDDGRGMSFAEMNLILTPGRLLHQHCSFPMA